MHSVMMKHLFQIVLLTLIAVPAANAQTPELRIDVAHPPSGSAEVRVGLYTDASNWLDEEPVHGMLESATDTLTTVVFRDLPAGVYGAAVYLDENRNGKLDRNLVGFFKEPYGFSKDARVRFGPPKWDDAVFEHGDEETRLFIRLD